MAEDDVVMLDVDQDKESDDQALDPDTPREMLNLLPALLREDPEWCEREAKQAIAEVDADESEREDFMKKRATQLKLFTGEVDDLGYPAEGAKAPHIAIMCKALLHLWARVLDQVVPAKGDIAKVAPTGAEDGGRGRRVEKHLNWQTRHRLPEWASSHYVSIMQWLLSGSMFRRGRWDPIAKCSRIDYLPIDDVILPYTYIDVHPLMPSVPRISCILRLTRQELEQYEKAGYYTNVSAIFPKDEDKQSPEGDVAPVRMSDKETPLERATIQIEGVNKPDKGLKFGPRELIEQHKWMRIPKIFGDDIKPVTFVVDRKTKTPVSLTLREEDDPVDRARFNEETKAQQLAVTSAMQAQQPPPQNTPRPPRKRTLHTIIHYRLFPNPAGIYGLGLGYLLASSNELANELAAEYMLSAKFHNMLTGWMAKGTREKRGDVRITHGKFIETELDPELLDKAIKIMDKPPPSEGLMKVVDRLEANAELAVSPDILSGEKGASNETAKGMMVRNSNAMALISVITRLYLEPLKYEFKLIAHYNSIFLDDVEYFYVVEPSKSVPGQSQSTKEEIGRIDYLEDFDIEFTADARMSSKPERISDAKDFLSLVISSPMVQNQMLLDYCFRALWQAAERPDYEAAMGPPPQPQKPPEPMSQEDENAGFFNEQFHPVLPDDNHLEHLAKIDDLKNGPLMEHMSSTGRQMLDKHFRAHISNLYLQAQRGQIGQIGAPPNGMDNGAGAGGAPPGPGGPEVPQTPGGAPPQGGEGAPIGSPPGSP